MKLALAFACLLVPSLAAAGPDEPVGFKPKAACETRGPVLVEIKLVQLGAEPAGHATTIFATGGWTAQDTDHAGKASNEAKGCIAPAELKPLSAAIDKATWKVTTARFHCNAMAQTQTEYTVRGKKVWTDKLCSGQTLDKDSAAAIDAITQQVAKLK